MVAHFFVWRSDSLPGAGVHGHERPYQISMLAGFILRSTFVLQAMAPCVWQVMIEVSSGRPPDPGPLSRRGARGRLEFVDEEKRRAADIAAMRNPGETAKQYHDIDARLFLGCEAEPAQSQSGEQALSRLRAAPVCRARLRSPVRYDPGRRGLRLLPRRAAELTAVVRRCIVDYAEERGASCLLPL